MKKILSVIVAVVMLAATFSLAAFADTPDRAFPGVWGFADAYKFYDETGAEITPDPFNDGAYTQCWSDGFWWPGYAGTKGHDSHGQGKYVTAEITGNKFRVYFCNNNNDCDTNAEIYVDGALKKTYNLFMDGGSQGQINYAEVELETAGKHTVKVLNAGCGNNPAAEGHTWNGMPFNCITYTDTSAQFKFVPSANLKFYKADDTEFTPVADGNPWTIFTYWTANGFTVYETNGGKDSAGNGCYVTATIENCDAVFAMFGNGNGDCGSLVDIYVDGVKKIEGYNPSTSNTDVNCSPIITLDGGTHTIKVVKNGGEGWQAMPFATFGYIEHTDSPATADLTGVIAVIGVVALAGTALIVKKH